MPASAVRERPTDDEPLAAEEALFREARALRRRRWLIRSVVAVALLAAVAGIVLVSAAHGRTRTVAPRSRATAALPTGRLVKLDVAGSLAVSRSGALYVADAERHRILVALGNGRFRVVAGTGRAGFSGDGGSALRARLFGATDLAFSRTGDLYFIDGGRVRAISSDGTIRTVAGDGRPAGHIRSGTPARLAPLGSARAIAAGTSSLSIAFSPTGELYVATMNQLMRLSGAGRLVTVPDVGRSPVVHGELPDLGEIAVDRRGDIDISGVNGWSIWQVTPSGRAHQVGGLARLSGGGVSHLQRAPNGAIYAEDGPHLLRVTSHHLIPSLSVDRVGSEYFWPTWFAFGPRGTTYIDELPGDSGFEAHQQLVEVRHSRVSLLWQQDNHGRHDSFGPH